ncbi:bifunctional 4-hydroxy-2-oxoglutarate aldolase/2-dehydro-3-deoxy-phosphogluconate aldolase [Parvularcula dongshanensis]|uniref:2-dehydro-3-deoxyphosphogluconate aldolase/(4S)-4-hydroxy-2-oxoglutarate aldolase n=1 Tax=Parvularcula dongshanensis TaxID=1173995 RepID=A0A840I134_9PROT|nr:bifunctional 4-hydroxy-2-oxoglutarate aldolase/2-dehydro-3-deoxy-phosphogluconate aldolase [Parvularcula dongshanensis]MBB4657944.1 2-dehydro-3-deoxyphosphogluconate aldolase/(4S)-4-hydroxy-2-oxoglutarate aldolase [Parvularcula dongshanensis]
MSQASRIDELLSGTRVMPVVVIERAEDALPLADALLEGGVTAIEMTLRTEAALPAAEAIAKARPDMVVGTGTVLTPGDLRRSEEAGARFAVSPGLTETLADEAAKRFESCPLLPGTATASEVMFAMERGFTRLKFFPAETSGGAPAVKALGGPLPQVRFCPTGGVSPDNAASYLKLPNVFCVGGSWLVPKGGDWAEVTRLARESTAF